jgi:hypothetical protein
MQQVHLRINDAATGKPTPVRLRVTDAQGRYHAPFGRLTRFATGVNEEVGANVLLGGQAWAYIDGACEINLPPGLLHISAAKGPEYRPLEADVQLVPGKLSLRFEIERWSNIRAEGWQPGDARAHFISPHAALLEAQAEDLSVVHLLARMTEVRDFQGNIHAAIPNLLAFSGQTSCLKTPDCEVAVNTENDHPELGSLGLLNCHRVVYPLTFGGGDFADDWTLSDWCGQCHRRNGLVVWTRTGHETPHCRHGEPLADLLLGEIDAFEIDRLDGSPHDPLRLWYDLLRVGCRVPLAGGSGKDRNTVALGSMRTYVHVAPEQSWIEGLRAGRSFVSNGPLLSFHVNEQLPGSTIQMSAGSKVRVQAAARSWLPFDRLEVFCNGEVVESATATATPAGAAVELELPISEPCWLAARCTGSAHDDPVNQRAFAHTSPVYVDVPGKPLARHDATAQRLSREIDRMIAWRESQPGCVPDRDRLIGVLRQARDVLSLKSPAPPTRP